MSKSKTSAGKLFEMDWKGSYKNLPIYYLRLQDAAKWNRGEKSSFVPESPYDAMQYKMPFIWLLELKSTVGTGVSFNPITPWEKPTNKKTQVMIKANQVKSLMEAAKIDGVIAGFIINFRERKTKTLHFPDETFFIHINDFVNFAVKSEKSGINREDCREIGMVINSKIKKVKYTYMVYEFVKESPKFYLDKGYIKREALIETKNVIEELLK